MLDIKCGPPAEMFDNPFSYPNWCNLLCIYLQLNYRTFKHGYLPKFWFFIWFQAARVTRKDPLKWTLWIISRKNKINKHVSWRYTSTYSICMGWVLRFAFGKKLMRTKFTAIFSAQNLPIYWKLTPKEHQGTPGTKLYGGGKELQSWERKKTPPTLPSQKEK